LVRSEGGPERTNGRPRKSNHDPGIGNQEKSENSRKIKKTMEFEEIQGILEKIE
jgi:hypothetical protein